MTVNPATQEAAKYFETDFKNVLNDLKEISKIPSISFEGFPASEVVRSAEATAAMMREAGLKNVELIRLGDAHPYVYGDLCETPGAPTLLLYAHHDVQPLGREEKWETPAFTPTEKEGPGGLRLYGRGTADDKAGILVHLAAIRAYLRTSKKLPVNVKVLIEGEEEIGSLHLLEFLEKYKTKCQADILVLTDTANFDCGIPALTTAIRGLCQFDIELRALDKTVHSGMWGGPVPDSAMALSKLLAKLVNEEGRITVPGVLEGWKKPDAAELKRHEEIPEEESKFREQSGMIPSAKLLREGPSLIAQTWRYPSLTVNALQSSSRKQASNIINDIAWARVTVRLAAGMKPENVVSSMSKFIKENIPWGCELELHTDGSGSPWSVDPVGPAFDAASRAMEKAYGRKPVFMGCGGSIPFVEPFAKALGGAPALLVGVEDPYTNAHGENESLLISDFKKACLTQIYLFAELGQQKAGTAK